MECQLKSSGSSLSSEEKTLERKVAVKRLIVKPFERDLKLPNTEQMQAIKGHCTFENEKNLCLCFRYL